VGGELEAMHTTRGQPREKGEGPVVATLQVARQGFGLELRRGTFHVLVGNNDVASIEWKQTIEVPIEPGHHTVQVTAGRYTSRIDPFDTADGETVNFQCHGTRIWPLYLASIVKPDLAIALRRE
jgi:hypothetical protein